MALLQIRKASMHAHKIKGQLTKGPEACPPGSSGGGDTSLVGRGCVGPCNEDEGLMRWGRMPGALMLVWDCSANMWQEIKPSLG